MFDTSIQTQATRPEAVSPVTAGGAAPIIAAAAEVGGILKEGHDMGVAFKAGKTLAKDLDAVSTELSGLDKKFSNINEAIASGGSKSALAMRAKTALNAAIASSPSSKAQADELYSKYFGGSTGASGGSAAGSFSLSPQEKAAQAAQEKAYEDIYSFEMAGYSPQEAQGIYAIKKQGEVAELQLKKLDGQSKVNMYQVQPLVDSEVTSWDVDFNVRVQTVMSQNGGLVPNDAVIQMGRQVDADLIRRRRMIEASITDPQTGMLSVSPDSAKALYKQLEDSAKNQKLLLTDNGFRKFIMGEAESRQAETKVAALKTLREVAIVRAAGGDTVANSFMDYQVSNNPKALNYLMARNPQFARILTGQDPIAQHSISIQAGAKIMGENGTEFSLSPEEAIIGGSNMSANPPVATAVLEKGNTASLKQVGKQNPASLAATFDPRTQVKRTKNASSYSENIQALQDGAMLSFVDLYRQTHKSFPTGIQVAVHTPTNVGGQYGKRGAERIVIRDKDGTSLSQNLVNQAADLYRSIKANPDALPPKLRKYYDELGPAGVTTLWLNSGMDISDFEPQFEDLPTETVVQSGYAPTGLIKEEQARASNTAPSSEGTNTLTKAAEMQGDKKTTDKEEVEKKKLTEKTNDFFSRLPEEFKEEFSALWGAFTKDFETTKIGKRGIYGD